MPLVHIRLSPLDRELPSLSEVRARRELPARLAEWLQGELEVDGDEIWIDLDDLMDGDDALPLIEQLLADLSLAELATIELIADS